jgi:hypothetical protein
LAKRNPPVYLWLGRTGEVSSCHLPTGCWGDIRWQNITGMPDVVTAEFSRKKVLREEY